MMNDGFSAADIAAVTNSNRNGWGDGYGWIWIILIFAIFGNGFWGGGNGDRYATTGDVQRGFDTQTLNSKIDALGANLNGRLEGINSGICSSAYENARMIDNAALANANGFNQTQMAIMQNGNNIVAGLNGGFDRMGYQMAENRYAQQSCCCETNRNIDSVKFEAAQNTCAITNAMHQEAEATRALIQANTMQNLRDKLEEKDRLYQAANFQISQLSQTRNIIDTLRPVPQPSYIVSSPYQAFMPYYGTAVGTYAA